MVAIVSLVSALAMTLVVNAAPADIVARVPGPGEIAANLKFFTDGATTVGHLKTLHSTEYIFKYLTWGVLV